MIESVLLVAVVSVGNLVSGFAGAWIVWRITHHQSPVPFIPLRPVEVESDPSGELEPADMPEKRVRV